MNYVQFEQEIKKIDPGFSITPNINRRATDGNTIGLCNIFYNGKNYDLPVVADEIKEEPDPGYRYTFPNGYAARIWSTEEVKARLEQFLVDLKGGKLEEDYE